MKFSVNSQVIQEGINAVTRAIPSKSAKQIFDGVCVEASDDTLSMTCTDGQFSIRWTGKADISEPGTAVIPGKLFSDLMRKAPDTTASFSADDRTASIAYGKSRSRLSVMSGTFPQQDEITGQDISIPACTLKSMINHITPSIATDETRIILTGGLMRIFPDSITMVSLDGFRLSRITYAQSNDIGTDEIKAVIPRKTLTELARTLPSGDDPITVRISREAIRFTFSGIQITSVLLAGEYMDYTRLIPNAFTTSINSDRVQLQDAIDRASLMAREGKNNLVRFDVSPDTIKVSANADTGAVEESLDILTQGNDLAIAFNAAYLSEAIRNAPDDTISINFTSNTSPCIISPVNPDPSRDWLYLILPVRTF